MNISNPLNNSSSTAQEKCHPLIPRKQNPFVVLEMQIGYSYK
jgi:hypothetical protein